MNDNPERHPERDPDRDPRVAAIPDIHGHAKGEHKPYLEERPIPLSARMLFLWFFHACRRGFPRFMMVADHMNYLTFEDPAAVNLVRRALKLAEAGDLHGAADTAGVEVGHAAVVSEGLRRGMRFSVGAEVDNDPRSRPDAQNIVDAMRPDGMIRSVHFLPITHPTLGENWNWPFDNPEFKEHYETLGTEAVWELYMATLLDAIERLPGQIIGHFYVPAAFGHWPDDAKLQVYEDRFIDACERFGKAVEFNTRFLYRDHPEEEKERYVAVHTRLLKKAKAKGVGVAVGSDAHSPRDQGHKFDVVLRVLDECEINELVFPIGGRLARVALRVERKPEPEPPPPPPPEPPVRKARETASPARPKAAKSKGPAPEESVPESAADPVAAPSKAAKPKAERKPAPLKASTEPVAEAPAAEAPAAEAPAAKPPGAKPPAAKPPTAKAAPTAKPVAKQAPAVKPAPAKLAGRSTTSGKPKPAVKSAPAKPKPAAKKPKPAAAKKASAAARGTVKKTVAKKTAAKKAPAALRAPAKKAPAKKTPARSAGKKSPKKAVTKKAPAKKTAAPARSGGAKKAAAKKPVKRR